MRTILFTLVVGAVICPADPARAQTKDIPPLGPVVIKTDLSHGWFLEIVVEATTTTSRVRYSSQAFLESTRASIGVKDCDRMAEALESAAAAVRKNQRFEGERYGDVGITIGDGKVGVVGKDGKYTTEERKVVIVRGGETGLFSKALEMNLIPEEAERFAKSLRAAPGVHARIKATADFDGMFKAK